MYAIVETGGKQYRVKPGDTVAVEKLAGEPGDMLDLGQVLLVAGNSDDEPRVGAPSVANAVVRAEVLAQFRGEKIVVFRYKSKVRYRRKTGHRQSLTRLRIADILLDGASSLAAQEPAPSVSQDIAPEAQPVAPESHAVAPEVPGVASESLEDALVEAEEPPVVESVSRSTTTAEQTAPTGEPASPVEPTAAAEGNAAAAAPESGENEHHGS